MITEEIFEKAAQIKLLLMDCDGVLTDGRITFSPDGEEHKTFHVRDGFGIVLLHRAGIRSGIISGRTSSVLERRAKELGIEFVRQGSQNKLDDFEDILNQTGIKANETAFIGDDLPDIPLLLQVKLPIVVADAAPETKQFAHLITQAKGGRGAVREVTDLILQSQQKWLLLTKKYFDTTHQNR